MDADLDALANVDPELAELIERAQSAAGIRACLEAFTWDRYQARAFDQQLFLRPEWVRVWLQATPDGVVCFAVEVSRRGETRFENPLDWL